MVKAYLRNVKIRLYAFWTAYWLGIVILRLKFDREERKGLSVWSPMEPHTCSWTTLSLFSECCKMFVELKIVNVNGPLVTHYK